MANKKRIGVIGCGQWGPNQIRTFLFHPKTEVRRVCDRSAARLEAVRKLYPALSLTKNSSEITRAGDIDAVVITTPVSTHFALAKDALLHGKDVLCEKPLTIRSSEAAELVLIAKKKKLILMVGHIFLFNPGILKIKQLLDSRELGKNYYLHAQRTNLGPVRQDVSSVYDLASHDISIFNFLLKGKPRILSVTGKCYLQPRFEDVAFMSLEYPGNILANIHVSWLDPKKTRQITVIGDKKMATWDDLSLTEPVRIYAKHVEHQKFYSDYGQFQLLVKEGKVVIPNVKHVEPLKAQADHFAERILSRKKPVSDGVFGLEVVKTLEEIDKKLSKTR